nr:unnamed protein product [Callosobruchus chinensis]
MSRRNKIIAVTRLIQRRREKQKRLWVHPIVSERLLVGAFVTLYSKLREDEIKFFNYFRMSIKSFDELHHKLENALKLSDTVRVSISSVERLSVCLSLARSLTYASLEVFHRFCTNKTIRKKYILLCPYTFFLSTNTYLASGNTFTDIHYTYRLGISTISSIVEAGCDEVWKIMKNECMPDPTEEKWREIAINFEKYANFPNCIGAVDGKHIRIVKPINSVLLAVCDANFCFTYIDVGAFGKFSDSNVFVNSEFWNKLENDLLHIPKERPISGDEEMRSFPVGYSVRDQFANYFVSPSGQVPWQESRI